MIAIQNARLFSETKEALEQQTATADVLQTINRSVQDTQPVFDTILRSCARLFRVQGSLIVLLGDDGKLRVGALHGHATGADGAYSAADIRQMEQIRALYPMKVEGTAADEAIRTRQVVIYPDVLHGENVPGSMRAAGLATGLNYSAMMAPLMRGDEAIGAIGLQRHALGPFAKREVALLKTFADQAVIAIQNARLFNETREALERQTASADILKVIAGSSSDVQPVFDAIAVSSQRLLGALSAVVCQVVDDVLHLSAFTPVSAEADDALASSFPRPLSAWPEHRRVRDGEVVLVADTEIEWKAVPGFVDIARKRGFRSVLFAPLVHDGATIGLISVTRRDPRSVLRGRCHAAADLRGPSGDRDPERAAVQRDERGARTTDRVGRSAARDRQLRVRRRAGVRHDPRSLSHAVLDGRAGHRARR